MIYTSRGHGCGIYIELIFVESKALKQAHSRLRNCFSNAALGKKSADRNPQPWPREVYYMETSNFKKQQHPGLTSTIKYQGLQDKHYTTMIIV